MSTTESQWTDEAAPGLRLMDASPSPVESVADTPRPVGPFRADVANDGPEASLLARLMRASRRTPDPAARAVDPQAGARARTRLSRGIDRLATTPSTRDLLLSHGLRPGFLGPAVETGLMACIAGEALGFESERLDALVLAAMLAEVGMLMVPREIVDKPGMLSPAEMEVVKSHPRIGAQLLEPMSDELDPLVPLVALRHHERRDGKGYPDGLSGDRVCPEAQLVWLCHLYLAGVTGRAYRPPLSPRDAMGLVTDFGPDAADPQIVRAFALSIASHPVGSRARLSTGECGIIVPGGEPLAPRVQVRWSQTGADLVPHEIDTSRAGDGIHVIALGE